MKIITIPVLYLLIGCQPDQTISLLSEAERLLLTEYENLNSENKLTITEDREPGEKLILCIKLIDKEGREPLTNQKIKLYHTSNSGEYEPIDINDESTARLNGEVVTNESGQIFVQTILPGNYGSGENNRHIHTTVENAKPEAYDIHFTQFTGPMGRNFISGSDQHFLADLKQTEDGILVTFLTLEIKNPATPPN